MGSRRVAALISVAAIVLSGCSTGGTPTPAAQSQAASQAASGCTVGVSWNNYQEERWAKWDEPAIKDAISAGGGKYINNDAKSNAATQTSNVEALISQGAKVLIILAQDGKSIKPAVTQAIAQGVPVIAYDRLIEDPGALYITFDNVEVGRMQARAVFAAKPKGSYVIIKGSPTDANAQFLRDGIGEVLKPAIDSGDIKILDETFTDNWNPDKAKTEMEQYLTKYNNKIDAAVVENDGMAGGVIAALAAQGMAGSVPVSGQDGDAAALNRVALGTQTVDVWKDARQLGKAAGEAAMQLCKNKDITKVQGTKPFTSPDKNNLTSILLTPLAITQDNLDKVVTANWISKEKLCQGVTADKAPPACK